MSGQPDEALKETAPAAWLNGTARWDQAHPAPGGRLTDPRRALAGLLAAGVRAAPVAPEQQLRRWFSWQWYWTDGLVDGLVRDGRVRRAEGHLTTTA